MRKHTGCSCFSNCTLVQFTVQTNPDTLGPLVRRRRGSSRSRLQDCVKSDAAQPQLKIEETATEKPVPRTPDDQDQYGTKLWVCANASHLHASVSTFPFWKNACQGIVAFETHDSLCFISICTSVRAYKELSMKHVRPPHCTVLWGSSRLVFRVLITRLCITLFGWAQQLNQLGFSWSLPVLSSRILCSRNDRGQVNLQSRFSYTPSWLWTSFSLSISRDPAMLALFHGRWPCPVLLFSFCISRMPWFSVFFFWRMMLIFGRRRLRYNPMHQSLSQPDCNTSRALISWRWQWSPWQFSCSSLFVHLTRIHLQKLNYRGSWRSSCLVFKRKSCQVNLYLWRLLDWTVWRFCMVFPLTWSTHCLLCARSIPTLNLELILLDMVSVS